MGVLMSGGLDSGVLLGQLLSQPSWVRPVYVRCGLRWEDAEVYWLRRFLHAVRASNLQPLRVINLPLHSLYGSHWSFTGRMVPSATSADRAVYLPGRNVLLLTAAAIFCAEDRISTLAIGTLKGNPFGDATPRFFRHLASCLSGALHHPIRVIAPLARVKKVQLLRGASDVPLALTFSCLKPHGHLHCGRCNKCAERSRAFRHAGLPDPTKYA